MLLFVYGLQKYLATLAQITAPYLKLIFREKITINFCEFCKFTV